MALVAITERKKQGNHLTLFTIQVRSPSASAEFSVVVEDQSSLGQNEAAALRAALEAVEEIEADLRRRLA